MPSTAHEEQKSPPRQDDLGRVDFALSSTDVRRKRPPALAFVVRMSTLRRLARVLSLAALDFAGIWLAIFVALSVKSVLLEHWDPRAQIEQTQDIIAFAYLLTVLLFARSGLYADRGSRPGLRSIVSGLFQVTLVALAFALVNGEEFSSYYIFYGSLIFAIAIVSLLRWSYEWLTGVILRAAGYQRRAVLVGTGHHIDEVIVADPDFPEDDAVLLVDRCHAQGVRVRIAPSTMELLIHRAEFVAGEAVPLFELKPPVFEGVDYAIKRTFDLVVSALLLIVLSPLLLAMGIAIRVSSRGPVIYRSVRP